MKKRVISIAIVACALCLAAAVMVGCSSGTSANKNTAANANTNTTPEPVTFTVGFDQEFPPWGYVGDDGKYTGFDLDLAAAVCDKLGWTVEYKPINWDAKDLELEQGAIDCIWNGFTITAERQAGYEWTSPYMLSGQVIVVKAGSGINSLADLAGKTVITQADSSALSLLTVLDEGKTNQSALDLKATFKELLTTPDYNTAFLELESGAVDAVALDKQTANFHVAGRESTFTILTEQLAEEEYGVGFLKGNTEMRDQVESTLKELVKDGTVKSLCDKYPEVSYDDWLLK